MRCYSHLSDDEREQIGLAKAVGHSIGAIAKAIGRPKSTVSRELSRNKLPSGRYSPLHAAGAYQLRRRREALIERDRALRTFVVDRLAEGWTPEQISGWLKGGNEPRLRAVGCETIYAFIYRTAQQAEQLWRYLTRHHKRRRPPRSRPSQDTIKDRVSIHERPKKVDARTEGGHWEGDLIICKRTRPVLVLHERKSRVTLAARLAGKTAAETISVMLAVFARVDPALRKSITFDNDTAFAQHALLRTMRAMTTWFCDAYASWQKGGVENANGRLRRWLPRQPDHPVPQGLPIHAADLRRLFPRGTVEHCCDRKQPARLSGVLNPRRQATKFLARKVRPHRNRSPHGKRPSVCHLESCCG